MYSPLLFFLENQQDVHQHNIMHKCVEHLSRSETNLGKLLSKVSQDEINSFYCLYLHDFVRFTYKTTHRDEILEMEYEVGDQRNKIHAFK